MIVTLIDRYLIEPEELEATSGILPHSSMSPGSLDDRYDELTSETYPRQQLSDALHSYNASIGNDARSLKNCCHLTNSLSTVVITGQQAGLFSGPLYTIYKIATSIRLARDETKRTGRPVIPVYWNATEDHDLSEIATCYFPGSRVEADFPKEGIAAERLSASVLDDIIDKLLEGSSEDHRERLSKLLDRTTEDYGHYSSAVIARLFEGTGLVILEPRILRPFAKPFFTKVITNASVLKSSLQLGADTLLHRGLSPAFTADDGTGLFYISEDGLRRQIRMDGDTFSVHNQPISQADLVSRISIELDSFSTGAWLRPILQSALLPVLAYVAGPGEYRYHLQLPPVFEQFDVTMPPIRLRNHATLLGPSESRIAAKLGLSPVDIFRGPDSFYSKPELPASYQNVFSQSFQKLDTIAHSLKAELSSVGLDRSIDGFLSKSSKELEKIRARAGKELERQAGVGNQRVDRFFQAVLPANSPQERRINILHFLKSFGPALIPSLIDTFDPDETRHYLITSEQ